MTMFSKLLAVAVPSVLALGALASPAAAFRLTPISTYASGVFDEGASEISAFDPGTARLFVTNANANTIDILDVADPSLPLLSTIDISAIGSQYGLDLGGVNSVALRNGILAAAVEADVKQNPGSVLFFDVDGIYQNTVQVGALPDMLTFTPDGSKVLVANEGEPNDDYTVDPEGSVSIIDISGGIAGLTNGDVTTAGFGNFTAEELRSRGVRIYGPGATAAQDLEPEYIAVSSDSKKAYVSLQENNAIGVLNIETGEIEEILPLGYKDHSQAGHGLDASDRDDAINITTHPVFGMYQPDALATFEVDGETYIITANEGDSRDYDGYSEEARIKDVVLDPTAFPNAAELQADENIGRLTITTALGDTDGDGDFDQLYANGARSFSIWDTDGNLVFDSGDQFETLLAERLPADFNSDNDENGSFDSRSDAKGPEPEGVTVGKLGDRLYAFIGLERIGGIMVYDITDPNAPQFVTYNNNRDFSGDAEAGTAGDLGPEGVLFIPGDQSPTGGNLLAVTNEVSGSTTVYSVDVPEPGSIAGLVGFGVMGLLGLKRQRSLTD